MSNAYKTEEIEQHGNTYRVEWFYDTDMPAPWDNEDGHGPVRMDSGRNFAGYISKVPGEMLLNNPDRHCYAYIYDFAEAVKIARRDGWNAAPYDWKTPGEQAHMAAMADFEHLRRFVAQDWHYCGIVVTLLDENGEKTDSSAGVWGVEDDGINSQGLHASIIQDLIGECDWDAARRVFPVASMGV